MMNNNAYSNPELQKNISEKLTYLFTPSSRLDKIIHAVIKEFMDYYMVPYFCDVITRHTEEEFHQKIADGFDLVEDMRLNHERLFNAFIKITKKFKNRLVFNETVLLSMIVDIVQNYPYFWIIRMDEQAKLYDMILRLKMEIYS